METLEQRLERVVKERIAVVPYDPDWPESFAREKEHLLSCLPSGLIRRIEHFGSTAVPGLSAKPIIDMLVEVADLAETRRRIVPILKKQGYEYFWRPSFGDEMSPHYAWFIKRNEEGARTHHIHVLESHFAQWDGLLFRDYLIDHPETAREYEELKRRLADEYRHDRAGYTEAKGEFIRRVTRRAKAEYDVS